MTGRLDGWHPSIDVAVTLSLSAGLCACGPRTPRCQVTTASGAKGLVPKSYVQTSDADSASESGVSLAGRGPAYAESQADAAQNYNSFLQRCARDAWRSGWRSGGVCSGRLGRGPSCISGAG